MMKPNRDQPKRPASKPVAKSDTKPEAKADLNSLPLAEVENKLGSSPKGLTQAEAAKRRTQYGPNEIEEKKTNQLLKFLSYFWGPIPWMIEAAVILSAVDRHWPDFGIILVLLFANAVVGFWEEHAAGNAIEALTSIRLNSFPRTISGLRAVADGAELSTAAASLATNASRGGQLGAHRGLSSYATCFPVGRWAKSCTSGVVSCKRECARLPLYQVMYCAMSAWRTFMSGNTGTNT